MMSEIRETGISRYEQENLNTKDKDVNSEVMSTLDKSLSPRHEDDVNCNNISMDLEQSTEGNLSSGACDPGEVHTAEDSSSDAQETTSPNNPGEVHTTEDSSSDAQETTSPNNPGEVHTTEDSSSDAQETTSPNNPGEVHTTEDSSSDAQETTSPNNPGDVHTTEDSSSDAQETISPNNPGDVHTTEDSSSDAQETTSPNNPGDVHTTEDSSGNVCQNINEATPEDEKEDQADHGKEYVSLDPETFVSLESESKPTVNQDSKPVLHQDSEPKVCQDIAPATSEPPSTDITSASLVTPATSEPPSTDVTSASLVTPATSEPPSTDVTSASHVADVTSATSEPLSTDVTSASHVADVTPATSEPPSTDVTSASHVADVTPATSEPPSTDVTSASLVENVTSATSEPPSTDITSVPLVADVTPATSEPPSADVTSVPLMEDVTPATSETPTEDVIPDPPTKDVTPEPPTEDVIPATSEPPTEDVIPEPPTKDVTPEPPTEDVIPATSEPPTEDVIPEPPTEDATPATSEPPTEDIIPDPSTKDVIPATSEPPTEDVTPEPSAKDATAATSEPPTEDVIPEPPTKDASPATSEPPTEDIIPKPAGSQQPTEENSSKLLVPSDTGTVNTTRSSVITSPDHEPRDADRHSTQTEDKGGDEGGDKPGDNKEKKRTFIFSESPGGLRAQVPVTIRVGPAVTLPVNSSGINLTPIAIEKAPGNRLLERPTAPYHVITNIIAKNQKAAHTSDNSSRPLLSGPISLLSNPASLISGSAPLLCAPVIPSLSLAKDSASTPGMPAFTAVAPTVLTAATSVIATATATPRHSQGRKPVLSAGISSNLAALFPSFASKFSTSTTPQSSAVSANVSPLVGVERPAVVVAEDAQQKQRNVLVGVIPTTPSGHAVPSSVIDISGVLSNPVPVITHISSLKGSNVIPSAQDKDRLNHISGARLKVGSAEMLHVPSEIEQVPQVDLSAQAQTYTLDLSQLRMPQILGVQTVPHPQKFGGLMAVLNGKGIPGASLPEPVPVMKLVNSVTSSPGQAEAAKNPGQSSHIKSAPHPVARRIWMSSCRPLDPASLERIGNDSKGNVYWYDGGKNMFQSPPSSDPAYKPSESELQLACKSMVQWTAKLKDLRTSDDIKLAQIIKDQFLNRVRVSTQRKSRDVTMFQKLQAVHNYSISNQTSNHPLPIPSNSSNQIKIISSTTSSGGGNTSTNSVLQSTFPQGSILVVPHPTSPFHTMLPVFANPAAVLMPQGTGAQSSVTAAATSLNVTMATVSSTGGVTTLLQPASITSGGGSSVLGAQQPIAIDGRLLGITGPNTSADRTQMMQIVQQAMASAGVCSPIIHTPTGKAPPTSTTPTSAEKERNKWEKKDKVLSSQEVLRRTVSHPMVYSMTVKDPVQLIKVSFESKSIEIAGEVPIKKMEVDSLSPDRFDKGEARKGEEGKDGEGEGGEGVASERREVEGDNKESLNIDEKDKEDLERTKQKSESTENVSKETVHEPYQLGTSAFHGHSSADLMSAELLLSLTGNSRQDWSISPNKSTPSKPTVASKNDILVTSSPSSSGPQTPSSARKRKQKPIASAKPQTDTPPEGKVPQGEGGVTPVVSGKRRRARKKKADDVDQSASQASAKKKGTKEKPVSKSKQFTPEELLEILNITPSVSSSKSNRGGVAGKGGARTKLKSRDSAALETGDFASSSRASDKMEELKASREIKPMKEYVIETDTDSNSSSSSSSSSRFTPNSNSSSDSSSDSSSNEDSSGSRSKDMTPGQERVKEKGRGSKRKTESQSSSSDDSSSDEEERTKGSAKRGGARGRGLSRGAILHGGHVVSIPTHLLKKKIKHSKKLKLISREVEGGSDKDAVPSKKPADFSADAPADLATLYASKGGVDLSILSELTKSVGASDVMEKTRSKRTCVRVREEISKLEEILKDDTTEGKPSAVSRTRGGGGRGRGRGLNARASLGTGRIVEDESAESGGVLSSVKKAKKATYSQFTHKRRKRKRKAPEEEPLWQPARKQPPGDTLKTVYIFSTQWANEAAEAVLKEKCNTIIQFHQKQPKDPGFHRHPRIEDEKLSDENEQEKTPDEGEMEEEVVKEVPVVKGQKRKSLQGNTKSAPPPPPAVKKRRNSSQHGKTPPRSHSPPSFLRSSQRLRRQRNQSPVVAASPPVAPVEDEEEEESQPSPVPVSPPSPPVAQLPQLGGSRGRVTRASQRLAKAKQKNDPSNKQEVPKEGENSSSEEDSLMSFPKRNKISEESHTDKEEDKDEEEEESEEREKEIIDPVSKIQSSTDSPQVDTNKSSNPPPLSTLDEDNYTICHGTPHSRSPRADISSPKDWPNNAGNKAPPLLSPHQQQAAAGVADHRNRLHSLGHSDSVPVNPSPPAEGVFSPPPQGNSPGVVMRGSPLDHPRPGSGGHMQQESGGSGGHTPTNVHPGSHHFPADYYHKDWSATGLAQYAGMTGGYPGMYNHAIPGLPYGSHAVQQIPGSNYAYPMPYSWTHHPSQLGSHGDHMIQQQRQSAGQQARAGEVAHHQSRQGIPGGGAESPGYPPAQLRQQMQSSTWFKEQGYPDSSPVTSPPPPATMEKLPHTSNSSGQIPAPILHQLGTSVSSQHGLTPHHQLTHPFSRSSSHSIAHEHMPHPHFPYSFDASSPASLHMWQQSQMQSQQIRQMHHHPPHLAPPPGLWYAPTAPHLPSHLIPQGGKKSSGGKMKTNGGEPPHAKISANRNTNNNNCSLVEDKLYVAKYKSRAFRDQHEGSAAESGLLVSNLATSQHKQAPPSGLWGEGGRGGGGGAGDTTGYLHGIANFPPPQDNVSASKESIGQHSSPPVDNYL